MSPRSELDSSARAITPIKTLAIGLAAGLLSGLLGVGGGIVIVPLLVLLAGFTQKMAHATSLAAVIPIAAVAAATYAIEGEVNFVIAAFLAAGALVGAPLGARWMSNMSEGNLKIVFGSILALMGAFLVWS